MTRKSCSINFLYCSYTSTVIMFEKPIPAESMSGKKTNGSFILVGRISDVSYKQKLF